MYSCNKGVLKFREKKTLVTNSDKTLLIETLVRISVYVKLKPITLTSTNATG